MKYYLIVTNRCARKGACEQAVIYLCLLKKKKLWNKNTNNSHSVQSLHLICHQVVQIQQKHLKFLLPCYFWRMAKKVLYYSLTPWRKCVAESVHFCMYMSFSQIKKKVKLFLSIVMRIETLLSSIIPYQCFFYFSILIIHIQKLRYNSVYIVSHSESESSS